MSTSCDRVFDYFLICGLEGGSGLEAAYSMAYSPGDEEDVCEQPSPLERSYKCKILGYYPKSVPWNPFDKDAISTLCLPHGLEFRTQKHKLDPYFQGFVVTREDGSRYYGFSFTFYEEVKDSKICTALHTLQSMHIAEASRGNKTGVPEGEKKCPPSPLISANTRSLPRHFRLSPLADKNAGEANKYYDIGKDQLFASKSIALVCQLPFYHLAKEFLSGLHRLVMREPSPGLCIEDYVYNVLYGIPLPEAGTSVGVKLWSASSPLLCLQLPSTDELPMLEFPLRIVFSLLPPRPLLQLFTSVLLENQVLLFSRDFNRLFLVAECVTALLFPFTWEHVYVPIVPASLMHFLDAPVPYIMGLQCSKRSRQGLDFTSQASLCVVDIDQGKVEVPEDTPALPKHEELLTEVTALLAQYGMKEPYDRNRNAKVHRYSSRRKASWCNDSDSGLSSDRSTSPSTHQRNHSSSNNVVSVLASPRISSSQRGARIAAGLQHQRRHRRSNSADTNGDASEDDTSLANDDDDDYYFCGNEWATSARQKPGLPPSGFGQNSGRIRQSDTFKRIQAALGSEGDVNNARAPSPGLKGGSSRNIRDSRYVADMRLNNGVRQVFFTWFIDMFASFENFVIPPTQDLEGWLSNRESLQNFDKSTYLGDQPFHHRPFLSRFLETQMFTSFIDAHILQHFDQPNPRVKFFEQRITKLRERRGEDRCSRLDGSLPTDSIAESESLLEPRLRSADVLATLPSTAQLAVLGAQVRQAPLSHFPVLDGALLDNPPTSNLFAQRSRRAQFAVKNAMRGGVAGKENKPARISAPGAGGGQVSAISMHSMASKRLSSINDTSQAVIADKNWKFVEELLKEAKVRTKRLLVEKLGAEAVALGHGNDSVSGVEENTLIAGLCDLLERIWSHGRQNKHQGKSALWCHLRNYQQLEDPAQGIDPNSLTPVIVEKKRSAPAKPFSPRLALPQMLLNLKNGNVGMLADQLRNIDLSTSGLVDSMKSSGGTLPRSGSSLFSDLISNASSNGGLRSSSLARMTSSISMAISPALSSSQNARSPSVPPQQKRLSRFDRNASIERSGGFPRSRGPSPDLSSVASFRQMPVSLTFDMSHVMAMEEIKTDVGYARAWVRLALEKKLMSTHLRTLLSNYDLLRSYYKRYAFLKCDEEREQFLYHLLSLNAVDFFCFTNTYTKTVIPYQVLVVPSKKQSSTSANVWVSLTGTLGETKPIELPRSSNQMIFEHRNLGVLSSMSIGHDNSGISPNWHVDHVLVRNEVTGHTFFFPCGRWLGRSMDDGSTVRLLVGELLRPANEEPSGFNMSGSMYGSMTGLSTSGSMSDSMYARSMGSASSVASPGIVNTGGGSASSSRPQSPAMSRRFADSRIVDDVQGMLSDAVNVLVKYFHRKEADRGSLTQLLCGEGGLVVAFERALQCGFKSSRLFSKNLYLWDYLVRVQAHYVANVQRDKAEGKKQTDVNKYRLVKSYCILIDRINKAPAFDEDQKYRVSSSLGKDDKFQLFVCISVRDHILSWFLDILAGASPTAQIFEEWSFLREPRLLSFLKRVLGALDEFNMSLETSVSKGIVPSMYKCFPGPALPGPSSTAQPGDRGRDQRRRVVPK